MKKKEKNHCYEAFSIDEVNKIIDVFCENKDTDENLLQTEISLKLNEQVLLCKDEFVNKDYRQLINTYATSSEAVREGIDAMFISLCGWRLKSLLLTGKVENSDIASIAESIKKENEDIIKAYIDGDALCWAFFPDDVAYVKAFLKRDGDTVAEDLKTSFDWLIGQLNSDCDANDYDTLRYYRSANEEQRSGMELVLTFITKESLIEMLTRLQ